MENNQVTQTQIVHQYAQSKPLHTGAPGRTITGGERPMMLNAWTQTSNEDFDYLDGGSSRRAQTKNEKELLDKIFVLENSLRAHAVILSQIHDASAPRIFQNTQQQLSGSDLEQIRNNLSAPKINASPHQSSTSVINTIQELSTESVKYTIIADVSGDASGDPIEIQLAEDDGALNMNSSADSGRLEICLAEENVSVKNEKAPSPKFAEAQKLYNSMSASFKRRKTETTVSEQEGLRNVNTNWSFYFNGDGDLKPMVDTNANTHNVTGVNKKKISLLKKIKTETVTSQNQPKCEQKFDVDNVMVSIGPNNTRIPAKLYENISWRSASIATRKLLMAIFDRKTLATHSMTGKPSPAFKDHAKPLKEMLNPLVIKDIIFAVTHKCNVSEKEVRNAITTKCADENKMMKLQMNKIDRSLRELNNKENLP